MSADENDIIKKVDIWKKQVADNLQRAKEFIADLLADAIIQFATEELVSGTYYTAGGYRVQGAFNTGALMRSSGKVTTKDKVIVGYGEEYASDLEYGLTAADVRTKVKLEDIEKWVRQKGFAAIAGQEKEIAERVYNAMLKNGVAPRPYFRRAIARVKAEWRSIVMSHQEAIQKIIQENIE